jgi:hypothetical protein
MRNRLGLYVIFHCWLLVRFRVILLSNILMVVVGYLSYTILYFMKDKQFCVIINNTIK